MKKILEQKRLEFLDETVAYYSEDVKGRRAVDEIGSCLYRGPNNTKCAIGRWIPNTKYSPQIEGSSVAIVLELIPKKISSLGEDFLNSVQSLHDSEEYWNKKGLSRKGKVKYKNIKLSYC